MKHVRKFNEASAAAKSSYEDVEYQKQKKDVYGQVNATVAKLKSKTKLSGEEIAKIVNNMVKDKETRDEFWKK